MKKIKKKDLYIIIGVIVVVIIIIWAIIFAYKPNNGGNILNPSQGTQNENAPAGPETSTPESSSPSTSTPTSSTSTSASLSYEEALKIYKDKRFQFSYASANNCIMSPSSSVFKKGTKVMMDNRYNKQITIYLDGTAYNIAAYDFKIITLTTSAQLPHTIKVDCDMGKNNGQIILQQ